MVKAIKTGVATVGEVVKARQAGATAEQVKELINQVEAKKGKTAEQEKQDKQFAQLNKDREAFLQSFYELTVQAIDVYTAEYNKANPTKKAIKGIHCKFSGYLSLMSQKFGISMTDVIETLKELVSQKVIDQRFTKGGAVIYKGGDMPTSNGLSLLNMIK
jgi:hypothetical protein